MASTRLVWTSRTPPRRAVTLLKAAADVVFRAGQGCDMGDDSAEPRALLSGKCSKNWVCSAKMGVADHKSIIQIDLINFKRTPVRRAGALRCSSPNSPSSAPSAPASKLYFKRFSRLPGESDVTSQLDRLSSKETKMAANCVRIAAWREADNRAPFRRWATEAVATKALAAPSIRRQDHIGRAEARDHFCALLQI